MEEYMKKGILYVVATLSLLLGGCAAYPAGSSSEGSKEPSYRTYLPAGYEEENNRSYPMVCLLPESGRGSALEEEAQEVLSAMESDGVMDMILICPELPDPSLATGEELREYMQSTVEAADRDLRTIPHAYGRAVIGAGAGGFLSTELAFCDEKGALLDDAGLFGLSGSIEGDYVSEKNPWIGKFGDFLSVQNNRRMDNSLLNEHYTFITAATEEPLSYEEGGVNDVISFFISRGPAYGGMYYDYYGNADETVLSATIENGRYDDRFKKEALLRALKGFTGRWLASLSDEELKQEPMAEKDDEKERGPLYSPLTKGDIPEGDFIDLMGEWKFKAVKDVTAGTLPKPSEYEAWEEVVPALSWWDSSFSKETDMKAYVGYAYYVKDFTLPADFPKETAYFPVGSLDETDMLFINGKLVGSMGMDEKTWKPFEDCWDEKRLYEVPEEILNYGGLNTAIVLTHNALGDGGWYAGHPGLFTKEAYACIDAEAFIDETEEREGAFFKAVIDSAYKASALGTGAAAMNGTTAIDRGEAAHDGLDIMASGNTAEEFLIYLPPGYFDRANRGERYPTVYLLHQLNSTSKSYRIDGIDSLVNEAIERGELPELIMVAPDSNDDGFWMGDWERMVTEEIIPYVDGKYRTIGDASHRFVAGASMGGCGAYSIGLNHPELFSGIISYFGAINMGSVPLLKARKMNSEELSHFRQFFIAGDRDLYKFGLPAIELDRMLREKEIEHYFELGEGGHDSEFYVPYVIESLKYILR